MNEDEDGWRMIKLSYHHDCASYWASHTKHGYKVVFSNSTFFLSNVCAHLIFRTFGEIAADCGVSVDAVLNEFETKKLKSQTKARNEWKYGCSSKCIN